MVANSFSPSVRRISARYFEYGLAFEVTTAIGPPGPWSGGGGGGAAVVKLQVTAVIVLFELSRAPLTVAVYVVDALSGELGVSVAVCEGASYDVAAGTRALPGPRNSIATEEATTGSEKVAVTGVVTATPLAPGAGAREATVGAVVSLAVESKTTSTQ